MPPRNLTFRLMIFVIISLLIIVFMEHFRVKKVGTQSVTRLTKGAAPVSSLAVQKMSHNGSLFSSQLWQFSDAELEKLYLYSAVLKKHSFNKTNVDIFREEIFGSFGDSFADQFIVDQRNTLVNSTLHYNLKTSPKPYFDVTPEFHRHLPKVARLGRLKKCSVVGNSGILMNSSCGREIDSSDFVFRCNAAPLKQFASDTGKKSNITSFNPSILGIRYGNGETDEQMKMFLKAMSEYRGAVLATCFSTWGYIDVCLKMLYNYNITENQLLFIYPDHFLHFEKFWVERKLTRRPSTGFYFTNIAINHCDEVHLYGFWPFANQLTPGKVRAVPYHYFDDMEFDFQIKGRNTHFMDKEFVTLLQFHSLGLIRIHPGACT